ncbi:MAG TPA: peptidoglycan DD-metalloendopeptidase family protein [Polyangiaceae bacterium]|nr:peptidoglycan DD-metalloendopeptidase family protein [Polyangiaceae bacterium]
MRRSASFVYALGLFLASGVALGVPSAPGLAPQVAGGAPRQARSDAATPTTTTPFDVELELKRLDSEQASAESEIDAIDKELGVVEQRVIARGRAYYKHVRAGLLPAGGGFDELVDHAALVERSRLALTRDLEKSKALHARRDELEARLVQIRGQRAPLDAHRAALRQAGAMMHAADDRRAAFDRAFDSSTPPPDYVAIYGADLGPSDPGVTEPFATRYGRLSLPVVGRAEVTKIPAASGHGPGLELHGSRGGIARSVAAGRVVFSDKYEDMGPTVIVDHGEQFFTVYGNLMSTELKVGDTVRDGEAIGAMGTRYGEGGVVLYFELRQKGKAVDPAPWFGL